MSNRIASSAGTRSMHSSVDYRISNRLDVQRSDQVCAYPRRAFYRRSAHNPSALPCSTDLPTSLSEPNETIRPSDDKPSDNIKMEAMHTHDAPMVIPEEYLHPAKLTKRRLTATIDCNDCSQQFKTKYQYTAHLVSCHPESVPR